MNRTAFGSRWIFITAVILAGLSLTAHARAADVLVFAAASLKPALDAILVTPEAKAIGNVTASYAASSQLARQIEHGAPAAIFISADMDWMNHVAKLDLIDNATRLNLLGNSLVLIAASDDTISLKIEKNFPLADALGNDGRLALGQPNSVPAGKYAKSSLENLGVWSEIQSRIVAADNVRAALNFVARKEAKFGVVYRSDAASEKSVRVIDTFPESSHAPIVYPIAIIKQGDSVSARQFLALLNSASSREIFIRYGFNTLTQ